MYRYSILKNAPSISPSVLLYVERHSLGPVSRPSGLYVYVILSHLYYYVAQHEKPASVSTLECALQEAQNALKLNKHVQVEEAIQTSLNLAEIHGFAFKNRLWNFLNPNCDATSVSSISLALTSLPIDITFVRLSFKWE